MIKGVSRYAVEIDKTNSPFFEKVICFVRPQYADGNALDLHREAVRMVNNLSSGVEEAQRGSQHVLKIQPEDSRPGGALNAAREGKSHAGKQNGLLSAVTPIKWLPLILSAGGGAAAAFLISSIF